MNVYYDPEKFGLQIVGEVEFSSRCYEFNTSVVWCDNGTGQFYVADDSGCSCPVPFEGFGVNDLTRIDRLQDIIDYFEQRKRDSYYYEEHAAEIDGEIGALILKVKDGLAGVAL